MAQRDTKVSELCLARIDHRFGNEGDFGRLAGGSRQVPDRCVTVPLRNRVLVISSPPLQSPPFFPYKQRVPRLGPQRSRARSEAKPIP